MSVTYGMTFLNSHTKAKRAYLLVRGSHGRDYLNRIQLAFLYCGRFVARADSNTGLHLTHHPRQIDSNEKKMARHYRKFEKICFISYCIPKT